VRGFGASRNPVPGSGMVETRKKWGMRLKESQGPPATPLGDPCGGVLGLEKGEVEKDYPNPFEPPDGPVNSQ